jgi:hypothetical protein
LHILRFVDLQRWFAHRFGAATLFMRTILAFSALPLPPAA